MERTLGFGAERRPSRAWIETIPSGRVLPPSECRLVTEAWFQITKGRPLLLDIERCDTDMN